MGKSLKKQVVAGSEGPTADKMAEDVIEHLEKKIKKCYSHREREVLRGALHLLKCGGCGDDRQLSVFNVCSHFMYQVP